MIRLPPTGISLSDNDVEFHQKLLDIRHSLLRQGFKSEDITRYLNDYTGRDIECSVGSAPSTLELSVAHMEHVTDQASGSDQSSSATSPAEEDTAVHQSELYLGKDGNEDARTNDDEGRSPELPSPQLLSRHAPRQSSLLRFSTAASSSSLCSEDDISLPSPITPRSTRRYRARAETYSYQESRNDTELEQGIAGITLDTSLVTATPARHLVDGNHFTVYNDSQPSSIQPATPADLARRPVITERDAAYTAPPGMLRQGITPILPPASVRLDRELDLGEQSPTVRAMNLRERRNRELLRGARAEGLRLQRMRMRDAGAFGGEPRAPQDELLGLGDIWRDVLDADRVGEENFESEMDVRSGTGIRVVSGNARF